MTVREFAMVACKILGLYFILIALVGFGKGCFTLIASMASLTQMDGMDVLSGPFGCNTLWSMFSGLISPVVELGIGLFVWNQADAIAGRITRDDS